MWPVTKFILSLTHTHTHATQVIISSNRQQLGKARLERSIIDQATQHKSNIYKVLYTNMITWREYMTCTYRDTLSSI
jgi:hypothetical protein